MTNIMTTCKSRLSYNTTLRYNNEKKDETPKGICGAVTKMEEQCNALDFQRRFLSTKVDAMEKSIPALLTYQLLNSTDDISLCKILDVLNQLSPYPDPSKKLADNIRKTIKKLNDEIKDYHEKIINAEFEIDEITVEISNMTSINNELLQKICQLEKEFNEEDTYSLCSIDSEGLECLRKIRKLGENELDMKNRMKELENREVVLREQMKQILMTKNLEADKCSCEKRQLKNQEDPKSSCRCLSVAKELFKDENIPNYNIHRPNRRCLMRRNMNPYSDQSHLMKPYRWNENIIFGGNFDRKPCECCKCSFDENILNGKKGEGIKEGKSDATENIVKAEKISLTEKEEKVKNDLEEKREPRDTEAGQKTITIESNNDIQKEIESLENKTKEKELDEMKKKEIEEDENTEVLQTEELNDENKIKDENIEVLQTEELNNENNSKEKSIEVLKMEELNDKDDTKDDNAEQ